MKKRPRRDGGAANPRTTEPPRAARGAGGSPPLAPPLVVERLATRTTGPQGAARSAFAHPLTEFLAATLSALALTFVAFAPGLDAQFASDDANAIVENEWVTGDLDAAGIFANFSWWSAGRADSSGYRPATTLSFAVNRAVAGGGPSGFRVVNYAMHALAAGLLFALARRFGLGLAAASAGAALFAVLPIHSEAVVWIVGRAELGASIAFLFVVLACVAWRDAKPPHGVRAFAWLASGTAAIALGMAFKENAVTALAAPAILGVTALAFAPRGAGIGSGPAACSSAGSAAARPWVRNTVATVALAAGIGAYALVRAAASGPALAPEAGSLLDNPLSVVDAGTRLLGAVAVFGRYVRLTVWPSPLSIDYSYDALGIGDGFVANADTAVAVAFVAVAAWAALRGPGRRDVVAAGLLLAAASFSIVSNTVFVIGTILGERLFYLPSAGLCLAVAAMADPLFAARRGTRVPAIAALAAVVVLAGASIAVGRARAAEWKTPVTLFEAAVAAVPRSARAHMELGSAYGAVGRVEDANRHFATALEILPGYAAAAYNHGNVLARAGRYDDAAAAYRRALAIDRRFTRAWHNLALTERLRGRTEAWLEATREAALSSPHSVALQEELGEALLTTSRYEEAIEAYDAAIEAGSSAASSWFNRGVARHHLGGCAAAIDDYRRATAAPGAPRETYAALAGCLRQLGRDAEAAAAEAAGQVANRDTRR